jgi:hypothetical protein
VSENSLKKKKQTRERPLKRKSAIVKMSANAVEQTTLNILLLICRKEVKIRNKTTHGSRVISSKF